MNEYTCMVHVLMCVSKVLNVLLVSGVRVGKQVFNSNSSILNPRSLVAVFNRTMAYNVKESGAPNSLEYRMYFRK